MQSLIRYVWLPVAALVLVLGGCGGKDPHAGTWTLDKTAFEAQVREMMAAQMPPAAAAAPDAMKGMMDQMVTDMVEKTHMTLTINADGTFKADGNFGGEEPEHHTGTWTEADGVITMVIEGDDPATGRVNGDALVVTMPNPRGEPMEMRFVRGG